MPLFIFDFFQNLCYNIVKKRKEKNIMDFEGFKFIFWTCAEQAERENDVEAWAEEQYIAGEDNVTATAALVTVLNHRCWYWYDNGNEELSYLYSELYYKYNNLAWDWLEKNGTDEEKHWYFETLD